MKKDFLSRLEEKVSNIDKSWQAVVGFFMALLIFMSINIFSSVVFKTARVDLTDEDLYSLSEITEKTLNSIDEEITLRFFFSSLYGDLSPLHEAYAKRVGEILERYVNLSDGKIKLELENPEPFSEDEDRAIAFGLQGVPLSDSSINVYFGLVATDNSERKKIIPLFDPTKSRFLEYDLTKLISDLTAHKKKKIGIMTTLPIDGRSGVEMVTLSLIPRWSIMKLIRETFDVQLLSIHTVDIPEDIDVLMLVNPKTLLGLTKYAIDQYVLRGGKLIVFADPHSECETAHKAGPPTGSPAIDDLLEAWGLELVPEVVVADANLGRPVTVTKAERPVVIDFLTWLSIGKDLLNQDDVITSSLDKINLSSSGFLKIREDAVSDISPLIMSSSDSMAYSVGLLRIEPNPVKMMRSFKSDDEQKIMAVHITGKVKTAFPKGPPLRIYTKKPKEPAVHITESTKPADIVLVADTDILYDQFWAQDRTALDKDQVKTFADNGSFVINALESLSGKESLIHLRGRGSWERPFDLVERITQEAERKFRSKEQKLIRILNKNQERMDELIKKSKSSEEDILTAAEVDELDSLRATIFKTRREVRNVQLALSRDIENLHMLLKICNIALMPILVSLFAVFMFFFRKRMRIKTAAKWKKEDI